MKKSKLNRIILSSIYTLLLFAQYCDCNGTEYEIPSSLRFTCSRGDVDSEIVYYYKKPAETVESFPILILCDGSSTKGALRSMMFMFKYFEEQVDALNIGFLAVEQWGINGNNIDEEIFFNHYSRTQRFADHMDVIKNLESDPPNGWNGKLIFLGVSEGGPLVRELTIAYPKTLATVIWSGAGNQPWADEIWLFIEDLRLKSNTEHLDGIPSTREEFDALVKLIKSNPSTIDWFAGMTYYYLADAFEKKTCDYGQIHSPLLVVQGTEDPNIESCDEFVRKAKETGAQVEYKRVEGMDHYIRKRPDLIDQSFEWIKLQNQMTKEN